MVATDYPGSPGILRVQWLVEDKRQLVDKRLVYAVQRQEVPASSKRWPRQIFAISLSLLDAGKKPPDLAVPRGVELPIRIALASVDATLFGCSQASNELVPRCAFDDPEHVAMSFGVVCEDRLLIP